MSGQSAATSMLLVRHGESTWNAVRRWQGQADPPLTELGERQAREAADVVAERIVAESGPFDVVVTSTLQRARRTGELLAERLSIELGPAMASLSERSAGAWEGLTRVEIEERDPGFLADGRRPTGYEADAAIIDRAGEAVDTIAGRFGGGRVLVVSHGGVINALERHVAGQVGPAWERLDNLEGRWFEHGPDGLALVGERVQLLVTVAGEPPDEHYA